MIAPVRVGWTLAPDRPGRRDAAWALLRRMVGAPVRVENTCPRCGGPHGAVRVHLAGADAVPVVASVSYAGGLAVVALAPASAAASIGVDAEPAEDPRRDARGMAGVLGAGGAGLRDWVRVEAALKADGRGLRVDPAQVRVDAAAGVASGPGPAPHWRATVPGARATFEGWDLPGPSGLLVSVALTR